ncbi:MAG: LmbE family protein, partial [Longimicrobiales bacterium]
PDLTIGYIEGAGDDGALALHQLGARVVQLDSAALADGDLARYDAIVTGIRAYEVRNDLVRHNDRLLRYTRDGGTFIVQYNKYELVDGGYAPYPLTMSRPHGRVTDENAPVRLLEPRHPALSWPNRIDASDFEGWAHERGLYFAETWDDAYTPLLAMSDAGEAPLEGSLLIAPYGRGHYVYTGIAFFRQFPEAVPGAYRLFANLVSLGNR